MEWEIDSEVWIRKEIKAEEKVSHLNINATHKYISL